MNIKIKKVLRVISKIILILIALGLVGFAGYYVYKAIVFKPLNVVVTNVTDVSATVTWTTNSPMKGVVYYGKNTLLPGPLGFVGANVGYDDRDVSDAQGVCVNDFNKQAGQSKDSSFSVDGSNFDCENVKVTKTGSYYTHSVTIKNLEENSTYNFVVGDGIWSFKKTVSTVKTFSTLTEVGEPMPVFGKIVGDDGTYSRDSIVYITFNDGSESKDSIVYSSAANDDGGWYLDASSIRGTDGNILPLELKNDTFRIKGTYSNYGTSGEENHIFGYFEVATFDLVIEKKIPVSLSFLNKLVMGVYAGCGYQTVNVGIDSKFVCSCTTNPSTCPNGWRAATSADLAPVAADLGYGNVVKEIAGEDGTLSQTEAQQLGLSEGDLTYLGVKTEGNNSGCTYIGGSCEGNKICEVSGTYTHYSYDGCKNTPPSSTPAPVATQKTSETCDVITSYDVWGNLDHCQISCEGEKSISILNNKCKEIYPNVKITIDPAIEPLDQTSEISVTNISLSSLSSLRIEKLIEGSEYLYSFVKSEIARLSSAFGGSCDNKWSSKDRNTFSNYCSSLGGVVSEERIFCPFTKLGNKLTCVGAKDEANSGQGNKYVSGVYAADASAAYAFYLPEIGAYSFEIDGAQVSEQTSNGSTVHLFYVEANGKDGFQMPADIENPTSEEDIVLSSNAYQITYKQESTAQQYDVKKGINIISFNFVPIATDSGAYTAQDVITQAKNNRVEIQYIATFDGGRWNNGYSCSSDTCTGNNFTIVPGKGYLVYATTDGQMTIPGYNLTSSVPVAFSAGWNLIGVHGYTTAYTARSFVDSINKIDGLTANNVSWWPTSKGKYEGLQVDNGVEYGLDFPISPSNGYFVRISNFKPSDTTCKSLIWNDGGSLNETCGNTK